MTFNFMRPALALAIALGLAGCGGKASFPVNGTVTGLSYDHLVLSTNGMNLSVTKDKTSFSFPNSLSYGDVYDVIPTTQPDHQTCTVANGKDTAGRLAAINISVACGLNQFTIGGKIDARNSDGLVLTNGSNGGTFTATANATSFTFANAVPYGVSYGVTVLTPPTNGDVCTVTNGTGIMLLDPKVNPGVDKIDNIVVTCVAKS